MGLTQYKVDQQKFIDLYLSGVPNDEIAQYFGITPDYIYTLVKRYKLPRRQLAGRPVPDGFAEDAPYMTYNALKIKYRAHPTVLSRWATKCGLVVGEHAKAADNSDRLPPPEDFTQQAKLRPITGVRGLVQHYNVTRAVVEHWLSECGLTVAENLRDRSMVRARAMQPVSTRVAAAAHYLRKFHRNVHSTDIPMWEFCDKATPNTWWFYKGLGPVDSGKYYVSGEGIVDQEWIIKAATRRGWRGGEVGD